MSNSVPTAGALPLNHRDKAEKLAALSNFVISFFLGE